MSRKIGLKKIRLEPAARVGHTEFIYNVGFMEKVTGLRYDRPECEAQFWKKMDLDFLWHTGMEAPKGLATKMGRAVWEGDKIRDNEIDCPFKTVEDVFNFDPVREYGICDIDKQAQVYARKYADLRKRYPDAIIPAGTYYSMVSFCVYAFGWDMFLMALGTDPERFGKVMEGFAKVVHSHIKAWLKVDIDCLLTHDDICWTEGPFTYPKWYREYVFPYFKQYWQSAHEAGKKVLYCSDGKWEEFYDDAANAGADGFVIEPSSSLEKLVDKYGDSKFIIGNADCRLLTYGSKEEIKNEIDRCFAVAGKCPGYFFCWSNTIPDNISVENLEYAFEYVEKKLKG